MNNAELRMDKGIMLNYELRMTDEKRSGRTTRALSRHSFPRQARDKLFVIRHLRKAPGFTLIELLTVIVIIGILATLVLANFNASRIKARDARRKSDIESIARALEQYQNQNLAYVGELALTRDYYYKNNSFSSFGDDLFLQELTQSGQFTTVPNDPLYAKVVTDDKIDSAKDYHASYTYRYVRKESDANKTLMQGCAGASERGYFLYGWLENGKDPDVGVTKQGCIGQPGTDGFPGGGGLRWTEKEDAFGYNTDGTRGIFFKVQ